MTTRKIGIPLWKTGENSLGSTLAYIMFAEQFGEVIPLMPEHTIREDLDLLITVGGADKLPSSYGECPGYFTQKPDLQKEYFDSHYLPNYIDLEIPIFSICRGAQAIATHFGSKLIQHMDHETNKADDPYKCVHKIKFDILNFWNKSRFTNSLSVDVNSRHHQTIRESTIPDCLSVIARHETDNHVEMIAHKSLPIVGVQFHPEDIFNQNTNSFIENIIARLIESRRSILIE